MSAYPMSEDILPDNKIATQAEQAVNKHFSHILFQNQEVGKMHNPYDQEVREISSIRSGDVKQLEKSISENISGHYGVLAKDNLRSIKNICIVVITLASRAAIEGGVTPEIAYSLSDSYIYTIEELSDPQTIQRLCRRAEFEYTRMVHHIKQQRSGKPAMKSSNPRVKQCKDYIFKHLHEKISIKNIAEELKMNANYLAELFSQSEGITIRDFIMQEKVSLAKNLLIYSEYSYSEIATSLGFCSQSHFGQNFKEVTRLTPRQYREVYGVKRSV
ncbi:helix-turn-helix domain-containing protein [Paenibacillus sp. HW567]|uniref:helix-turn-helix domain-containing protein n=1 Tax=Paenibacillus sp. HW567 TaxID=1034769 RepID=UPI00037116B0|nr:helix-turn-helix domain-containing protein [Paenibacillus sp. HW567]